MTNPLTVNAPEGLPFVDFEREFDAPVAAVFRAHQDLECRSEKLQRHPTDDIDPLAPQGDLGGGPTWT